MFGAVTADSTLYRTMPAITPRVLAHLTTCGGGARPDETEDGAADAWLVEIHSENTVGTRPNSRTDSGSDRCSDSRTSPVKQQAL